MHNSLLQFTRIIASMVWFMIFQFSHIKVVFSNPQYGEREREREKTNKCRKVFEWENFQINLRRNDNQSGSIRFRFSWICNVLWDRLKANISRMFRIYRIPLLKLLYFTWENDAAKTARQTGTNLLNTKSSHDTTNGVYLKQKIFKKNATNFSSTHVRICIKDATPLSYDFRIFFRYFYINFKQYLLFYRFPRHIPVNVLLILVNKLLYVMEANI